jgi:hypothetical protein
MSLSILLHMNLEGPETATRGGGGVEREPQISFETFDHCSKIDPPKGTQPKAIKHEPQGIKRT